MPDRLLDFETARRARDENDMDHEVWRRVVDQIYTVVVTLLGRASLDCEDVTHDAWFKVDVGLHKFEPRDQGTFRGWIRTIARNAVLDHCRREKRYRSVFSPLLDDRDDAPAEEEDHGPYDLAELDGFDAEKLYAEAFDTLSPEYRIPLYLRFTEGKKVEEVAAQLGVPEGTVKSRCSRGIRQIRAYIERARRSPSGPQQRTRP